MKAKTHIVSRPDSYLMLKRWQLTLEEFLKMQGNTPTCSCDPSVLRGHLGRGAGAQRVREETLKNLG